MVCRQGVQPLAHFVRVLVVHEDQFGDIRICQHGMNGIKQQRGLFAS